VYGSNGVGRARCGRGGKGEEMRGVVFGEFMRALITAIEEVRGR